MAALMSCPDWVRGTGGLLAERRNIWRQLQLGSMRTPSVENAVPEAFWTAPSANTPQAARMMAAMQAARNASMIDSSQGSRLLVNYNVCLRAAPAIMRRAVPCARLRRRLAAC